MNTSFLKTSIVLVFLFIFFFNINLIFKTKSAEAVTTDNIVTATKVAGMFNPVTALPILANETYKAVTGESETVVDKATSYVGESIGKSLLSLATSIIQSIGVMFLKLANFILLVSGKIFDAVLDSTVKTSNLYDAIKEPISNSWKIIRDVANIAIVFSLLYLAIRTILNGNGFADTKTLAGVLVAAILINFSLFFTQIAFTTSNFLSKSIAEQITFSGSGATTISENIARMVGTTDIINKLWNAKGTEAGLQTAMSDMQAGVLAGLTTIVIAVILFIAALMMLYRFLLFTFLMITSPIGLISSFIPWFKGVGSSWWGQLKKQFLFLPVFMLTLYIALLFIGTITKNITPSIDFIQFFFYFILTCGFLLGVLIIPTQIAGGGASMMTNFTDWGQKKLRALPKRSLQVGGQAIASGGARATRLGVRKLVTPMLGGKDEAAVKKIQEQAQGTGLRASWARERLRTADSLNNRSFDLRNVGGIGKKLGIGEGIESWNAAVKRKKEKIDTRRQKEEKLFGYDKISKNNQDEVIEKSADRDVQMGKVVEAEKAYKDARSAYQKETNATIKATMKTTMETKLAEQKAAQDQLEKMELEVGKAKNKGMVEHMKLVKKRNERMWNKLSQTQKEAIKEIEKELEKKWKEDGKGKRPKEKKGGTSATPPPLPRSGPSVSVSGTRPPTQATGTMGGAGATVNVNFGAGSSSRNSGGNNGGGNLGGGTGGNLGGGNP